MSSRDDQSWDFSFYKNRHVPRSRRPRFASNETARPPRPITSRLQVEGGLRRSILRVLSSEPYLTVDDIFKRFDFGGVTISPITVSGIISEFRRERRRALKTGK